MSVCCRRFYPQQWISFKKIRGVCLRLAPAGVLTLTLVAVLRGLDSLDPLVVTPHLLRPGVTPNPTLPVPRPLPLQPLLAHPPPGYHLLDTASTSRDMEAAARRSSLVNATCSAILSGKIRNQTALDLITSVLMLDPLPPLDGGSPDFCTSFRRRHGMSDGPPGGMSRWPVTREELAFPLAFTFKLHKAPHMFEQMLAVLWRPHNFHCVHVDLKAPDEFYRRVQNVSRCFDNIVLTPVRHRVDYATVSSLNADIECCRAALRSHIPWRYHVNLCGQEFPLKTNLEMVRILTALNGSNDVENYPPSDLFKSISFANRTVLYPNGQYQAGQVPKPPFQHPEVELRKGSAYNTLSRPFVRWALDENNQLSNDLLLWLNDTWAADELFWATLSFRVDAPGGPGVELTHDTDTVLSKAVIWAWDDGRTCRGTFVRFACIFGSLDLPWLLTRHELVANKFDAAQDSTVLFCLETALQQRALQGYRQTTALAAAEEPASAGSTSQHLLPSLNWTFYRQLPQFRLRQ